MKVHAKFAQKFCNKLNINIIVNIRLPILTKVLSAFLCKTFKSFIFGKQFIAIEAPNQINKSSNG